MATYTTAPQYDSLLDEAAATTAVPTATTATIGRVTGGWRKRLGMRFDLRSLSAPVITAATLTLVNTGSGGVFVSGLYYARRLTQTNWNPTLATWETYDGGNVWDIDGGDYTLTSQNSCTIASATANLVFTGLATLAQDATANRSGYLDLLIMANEIQTESVIVCTKDHGTSANRPSLAITYTIAGGRLLHTTLRPRIFRSLLD